MRRRELSHKDVDALYRDLGDLRDGLMEWREELDEVLERLDAKIAVVRQHKDQEKGYISRRVLTQLKRDFKGCHPKLEWGNGLLGGVVYYAGFADKISSEITSVVRESAEKALHKDEFCYLGYITGEAP